MPLITATETGNNYLEKTNTGADTCVRTAIRSYHKQLGSDGAINKVFTLPWYYVPESHTLWVYVNGQKAEYYYGSIGTDNTQLLRYWESGVQEVTFYIPLEDDDVIEFIVAGNYSGEIESVLAPDLSIYKTKDGTGAGAQNFTSNQPMGSSKFTQLPIGTDLTDSVNVSQLGPQVDGSGVHYHSQLMDNAGSSIIVSTATGRTEVNSILDVNSNKIENVATGTVGTDGVNFGQVSILMAKDLLRATNLASAPVSPVLGQIYWDTTLNTLRIYTDLGWKTIQLA